MKITGVHHSTIGVSDLECSLAFYRDLLGLRKVRVWEEADAQLDLIVGLEDARLRIAHLDTGAGVVELIEYAHPKGRPISPEFRQCDIGPTHLAFLVEDIEALHDKLRGAGVRFSSPPQERPNGWKATYFFDPDGTTLELLQEP
ncbi:MAG: VOC family protein [Nitrospinota bacterium]|jgi:glyoxylase I family protein|nr:VOC family protein [Nitrospinota bacterium]MDP7504820.1 VOC family protein [Nitrospinota bacterium]MDP7661784.1 VOC family protein [Nitrospinota bacterium]HJP14932.1 VOC family protein [Nitrospinota bacterium]